MSSGHAFSPRSPRESFSSSRGTPTYDARYNGDRKRRRSRSPGRGRGSASRARRSSHNKGRYLNRDPDPDSESYYGTRGKSYRPNYDDSPRRAISPRRMSLDIDNVQPLRNSPSAKYKHGDIILAKQDQRKEDDMDLHVRQGDRIKILSSVSSYHYQCENLESGNTGEVHSRIFGELLDQRPKLPESAAAGFEIDQVHNTMQPPQENPSEEAVGEINTEAIQTLKNAFSKIFEVSIDIACTQLRRDTALEIVETRTAAFNKSKEHHEKFPPLRESQTKQKLEAQKKLATLDQKLKAKNEALQGLITNAVRTIAPTMTVESHVQPEFELQLQDIQRKVEHQATLLREFQQKFSGLQDKVNAVEKAEDVKSLKEDIAESKRNADMAVILSQRVDKLEPRYEELGSQIQKLVDSGQVIRDDFQKFDSRLSPIEQGATNLTQRIGNLEPQYEELNSQVQKLVDNEKIIQDNFQAIDSRIVAIEQDKAALQNMSNRVVIIETGISRHDEALALQQKDLIGLLNADIKNISNFKTTTDRLDRIDNYLAPLSERVNAVETKSDLYDNNLKKAEEAAAQSLAVDDRLKILETQLGELQKNATAAGEAATSSLDIDKRLQNIEAQLPELGKIVAELQTGMNTVSGMLPGIDRAVAQLNQFNKAIIDTQQSVASIEHRLENLRSRVDNICTLDLAKAMVDQIQFVYPNLKNINDTVSFMTNQISQITRDNSILRENGSVQFLGDTLVEIRKNIDALQRDTRYENGEAVNKILTDFINQYNSDCNRNLHEITGLKRQLIEVTKFIEKLQVDGNTTSTKIRDVEIAIDLTTKASERIASLEAEVMKNEVLIKEKLDLPLKQINKISMEMKELKEQKGKVNDLTNRMEKLERRRPTPVTSSSSMSIRGASKKRPPVNGSGSPTAKRRNTVENDKDTIFMPANQEENGDDSDEE